MAASDGLRDGTHGPFLDPLGGSDSKEGVWGQNSPPHQGLCGLRQGRALHLGLVMTSLPSELLIESKGCSRRSGKGWGTERFP